MFSLKQSIGNGAEIARSRWDLSTLSARSGSKSSESPLGSPRAFTPLSGGRDPSELCKMVLNADPSIAHSSLVNANGRVITQQFREGGPSFRPPEGIENRYGHWVRILLGISKEVDSVFGHTELITLVHKGFTLNAIPMGDEVGALAFVADRSANLEYLTSRVRRIVGI